MSAPYLKVSPGVIDLSVTETATVKATYVSGDKQTNVSALAVWSSNNPSVASVAPGGKVTGISEGETYVVVSYKGISNWVDVNVIGSDLTVIPTNLALKVNGPMSVYVEQHLKMPALLLYGIKH